MKKIAAIFVFLLPFLAYAGSQGTISVAPGTITNWTSGATISYTSVYNQNTIYIFNPAGVSLFNANQVGGIYEQADGSVNINTLPGLSTAPANGTYTARNLTDKIGEDKDAMCGAGKTITDCTTAVGNDLMWSDQTFTINISAPTPPGAPVLHSFTLASSTGASIASNISLLLGDGGLVKFLAIIIGVPLGFFVIAELIDLIPRDKKGLASAKRAEKEMEIDNIREYGNFKVRDSRRL